MEDLNLISELAAFVFKYDDIGLSKRKTIKQTNKQKLAFSIVL